MVVCDASDIKVYVEELQNCLITTRYGVSMEKQTLFLFLDVVLDLYPPV